MGSQFVTISVTDQVAELFVGKTEDKHLVDLHGHEETTVVGRETAERRLGEFFVEHVNLLPQGLWIGDYDGKVGLTASHSFGKRHDALLDSSVRFFVKGDVMVASIFGVADSVAVIVVSHRSD